jgi:hypothetical protein
VGGVGARELFQLQQSINQTFFTLIYISSSVGPKEPHQFFEAAMRSGSGSTALNFITEPVVNNKGGLSKRSQTVISSYLSIDWVTQ